MFSGDIVRGIFFFTTWSQNFPCIHLILNSFVFFKCDPLAFAHFNPNGTKDVLPNWFYSSEQ